MDSLYQLGNPVFSAYVIAAAIMVLKVTSMSWLTVVRMMRAKAGFRAPEDLRKTPLNKEPHPDQVQPNEYVERIRRIHHNDLENVPFFLAAGFVFIATEPSLILAQILFYGYAATRILHFFAYLTAQSHDLRAAMWTPGSLIIIYMAIHSLVYTFMV